LFLSNSHSRDDFYIVRITKISSKKNQIAENQISTSNDIVVDLAQKHLLCYVKFGYSFCFILRDEYDPLNRNRPEYLSAQAGVKELLGHSDIRTTEIYAFVLFEKERRDIELL